jgi:hypothetical protein
MRSEENPQEDRLFQLLNALMESQTLDQARFLITNEPALRSELADKHLSRITNLQPSQEARHFIERHRLLLRRCREVGVDAAFAELASNQTDCHDLFQRARSVDLPKLIERMRAFVEAKTWVQGMVLVNEYPELSSDAVLGLMLKLSEAQTNERSANLCST